MSPRKREPGQYFEMPEDHVHADEVRVSVVESEDFRRAVLLEIGSSTAVITADEALLLRESLLAAATDIYVVAPSLQGHTH